MPAPRSRPASSASTMANLAMQSAELALAAPQVVMHRMARMAMAGPVLSASDRLEFQSMVSEKAEAFSSGWTAMAAHAVRANQSMALTLCQMAWSPAAWGQLPAQALQGQMLDATLGMLGKGLAPVHAKAVSNAKRLARGPRR